MLLTQKTLRHFVVIALCLTMFILGACAYTKPAQNEVSESIVNLEHSGNWCITGIPGETEHVTAHSLSVQYGTQIAIDEINLSDGINGFMITFSFDKSWPTFQVATDESNVYVTCKPIGTKLAAFSSVPNPDMNDEEFLTKYKQMFGTEPDEYAQIAYQSIYFIKNVLENADAAPDMKIEDLCDLFKDYAPDAE